MSLTSGENIVRYRWTEQPMPHKAIAQVSTIGRLQGMPSTLTYANRRGAEITLDNYPDVDASDSDDDTYSATDTSSHDSFSTNPSDNNSSVASASSHSNGDSDDNNAFKLKTAEVVTDGGPAICGLPGTIGKH